MSNGNIMVKTLKVDLSNINFSNPEKVTDGRNGRILENAMREQNFPISSTAIVDLPGVNQNSLGIEVKSRSKTTKSMHTVGTMTYDNIISTDWNDTNFKQKLQQQWRVNIANNTITGKIDATGTMFDLTHPDIQELFEKAYEDCRSQLAAQGKIISGQTISGGKYGALEHKRTKKGNGKSYAMRIPHSGMKKVLTIVNSTYNQLFE